MRRRFLLCEGQFALFCSIEGIKMFKTTENRLSAVTIHPLEYRPIVAADLVQTAQAAEASEVSAPPEAVKLEERIRELEEEIEERERSFENELNAARKEALEVGRASERGEHTARVAAAAEALREALKDFVGGRDRYLAQVEQEVVRLALAIAARILHREAMMDPLLLAGAVRVALGQLADTTEVKLRVPVREHGMWSEMLRLLPNLPLRPAVIADEGLMTGECLFETHLGNVDLGVRSQIAEIERGFFDLLERREGRSAERQTPGVDSTPAKFEKAVRVAPETKPEGECGVSAGIEAEEKRAAD